MAPKKARRKQSHDPLDHFEVYQDGWPYDPEIDYIVTELLNPKLIERFPGTAIAVRKDAQVVHLASYGYANLETGQPLTLDSIFDLGSLSKQFTAYAVLELVNNKQLSLNDPLSKFFKGFPRYADSITVEDLLHHTSALPDYTKLHVASRRAEEDWYDRALSQPDDWYPKMLTKKSKEITNKDVVRWIGSQKLLAKDPDTEFDYSNSGYVVLAELVSRVSKKRFAQYLKEVLFDDTMMEDTYVFDEACNFSRKAREIVNHARCYNRVNGEFVPVGYTPLNFINGDGNVHSTIKDLLRWEIMLSVLDFFGLCNPVEAKDKQGHSIRELFWSPVQIKKRKQVNYGAGWNLLKDRYEKDVTLKGRRVTQKYESRAEYHRGIWLGWQNYFARGLRWLVPEAGKQIDPNTVESLGIIVLCNADFGDKQFTPCRIAQAISQLYWGKWKKDNIMNNFNCG